MPFKLSQDRRRHGPEQKRKVINWRDDDASLRRRGGLTAWFTPKAAQVGPLLGPLLGQVAGEVASFTADGACDQGSTYGNGAERHPDAAVAVPPRATAVPSETAETAPTQRGRHLQCIAEHGRLQAASQPVPPGDRFAMGGQKRSGHNKRARAEAAIGRWKQVIGDGLRSHAEERRATEGEVAVHALNRMLDLGRPIPVRTA